MAQNIKTVQGITIGNTKTIQGIVIANIKTIQGIDNTSGGTPAWSDSIASGAVNDGGSSDSGVSILQPVTAGQAGDITKVRVWAGNGGLATDDLKVAIYDGSSGDILTDGLAAGNGPSAYTEVTVTPIAVTASQVVYVAFIAAGTTFDLEFLNGQPADSCFFSTSGLNIYPFFPVEPYSPDGGLTRKYPVGIYIEP